MEHERCVLKYSLRRPLLQRFLNLFVSLQLREIEWESSGFLLHDRRCDVACFIYDSTNASSFAEVVQLREVISLTRWLNAGHPRSRFLDVTQRSFGGTLRDIQITTARERLALYESER